MLECGNYLPHDSMTQPLRRRAPLVFSIYFLSTYLSDFWGFDFLYRRATNTKFL